MYSTAGASRLRKRCQIHSLKQMCSSASDSAAFPITFHQYILTCVTEIFSKRSVVKLHLQKAFVCSADKQKQLRLLTLTIF